jgi:beta-glucosidase
MSIRDSSIDEQPWMMAERSPEERASLLERALTDGERYGLLHSRWAVGFMPGMEVPQGAVPGAGYVPPIPRLGVPGLYETDASLGVTNPRDARPGDSATALPSGLALASTWDHRLAFEAGRGDRR